MIELEVIPEHWPTRNWPENCEDPRMAPYSWTVREGSLDGPWS